MQIALFYASWENHGEPWSTPLGIKWELESRGHNITCYNLYHNDGQLLPKHNVRTYSGECFNIFNVHYQHGYRPDIVLVMDYGPYDYMGMDKKFFPDVKFILEAGDTPQSFSLHARKAGKFHAVITPDWESTQKFNEIGIKCEWLTHWADNRIFHNQHDVEVIYDVVSTCGGRKMNGEEVTAKIQNELGDRFNNERYFFGEDHAKRLRMGNIVFQCSQYKEITRRIFEGMACGRMVLTDRLPELSRLDELFIDGEDIVYYDNAQDAIDKIKYYTEHSNEREQIAQNGFNKVMAHHTITNRIDALEELINEL